MIFTVMLITMSAFAQFETKNNKLFTLKNVGIGTNNPGRKLEIDGDVLIGGSNAVLILQNGSGSSVWDLSPKSNGLSFNQTGIQTSMFFKNGGNIGIGTSSPRYSLDVKGDIGFQNNGSKIYFGVNDYLQFTDGMGDGFKFVYDGTERVRIDNAGRVGIGTTNPKFPLHVVGDNNRLPSLGYFPMYISNKSTKYTGIAFGAGDKVYGALRLENGDGFSFFANKEGVNPSLDNAEWKNILRITGEGKVGIGTANPYEFVSIYKDQAEGTSLSLRNNNTGNSPNAYAGLAFYNGLNSSYIRLNSKNATKDAHCMELITFPSNPANPADIIFKASKNEVMRVKANGTVGIGTTKTNGYKLAVDGTIGAREIVVNTEAWADFVFAKNYRLMPLSEVESFITENNHLPDVPSEQEVKENGINVAEMNAKLLQKIEELTLYVIEQNKRISELEKQVKESK